MSTEKLTDDVKTRVPKDTKRKLEAIAKGRHLKLADIVREALREYTGRANGEAAKG